MYAYVLMMPKAVCNWILFAAITVTGTAFSAPGPRWASIQAPTLHDSYLVMHTNGLFRDTLLLSEEIRYFITSIVAGPDGFVAAGGPYVLTSSDGTNWL